MRRINALKSLKDCLYRVTMQSPVGELTLIASNEYLLTILWDTDIINIKDSVWFHTLNRTTNPILEKTKQQLIQYFEGKRRQFDLPIWFHDTEFRMQAWRELQKIPYGETISYSKQASRMGGAQKARAVGQANGCNPISIIIPCHRVIGQQGELRGFGGGLDKKSVLLQLEQQSVI